MHSNLTPHNKTLVCQTLIKVSYFYRDPLGEKSYVDLVNMPDPLDIGMCKCIRMSDNKSIRVHQDCVYLDAELLAVDERDKSTVVLKTLKLNSVLGAIADIKENKEAINE